MSQTQTNKQEILAAISCHVGSTYKLSSDPDSWRYESINDYIDLLDRLVKLPTSPHLKYAKQTQDKDLVTRIKLKQEQRRWYVDMSDDPATEDYRATAILLDFDQPKTGPKTDLYTDVVETLSSLPNHPYMIVSTTSSDGVHVVIPTKYTYNALSQPDMATAFYALTGIASTLDTQATGGIGKGFFDPVSRTNKLRYTVIDGDIFDHKILKVVERREAHKPAQLQHDIQETLQHQHAVLADQLTYMLEEFGADQIRIKPSSKRFFGALGTYVLDGVKCSAVCYSNGIMVGMAWDKSKRDTQCPTLVVHDRIDNRKKIAMDVIKRYTSAKIDNVNQRWYAVDGKWLSDTHMITMLSSMLDTGYHHVITHNGVDSDLTWAKRMQETREIVASAMACMDVTHRIHSHLRPIANIKQIWMEMGNPAKLDNNIHVHIARSATDYDIAPLQQKLGYPLNGMLLSRRKWPIKKQPMHMSAWHRDNQPDFEATQGYIQRGWTMVKLAKHISKLPPCVIVVIPDQDDKRYKATAKDPHRYTRELTLARQRIHAAALRGSQVIVIVSKQNYAARKSLCVKRATTSAKASGFADFAIQLPQINAGAK